MGAFKLEERQRTAHFRDRNDSILAGEAGTEREKRGLPGVEDVWRPGWWCASPKRARAAAESGLPWGEGAGERGLKHLWAHVRGHNQGQQGAQLVSLSRRTLGPSPRRAYRGQ